MFVPDISCDGDQRGQKSASEAAQVRRPCDAAPYPSKEGLELLEEGKSGLPARTKLLFDSIY